MSELEDRAEQTQDINCDKCGRYIGKAHGTVVAELICPNTSCKAGNQIKIVSADRMLDIKHKFLLPPKPPKMKAAPEVS